MAKTYAKEIAGQTTSVPGVPGLTDTTILTAKTLRATIRTIEYNAQAVNDTVELFTVRAGERLLSIQAVTNVSLSSTFDIGTDADPDKFAAGVTLTTNVRKEVLSGLMFDNFGVGKDNYKISLTVKSATMPTASTNPVGSLQFLILTSDMVA